MNFLFKKNMSPNDNYDKYYGPLPFFYFWRRHWLERKAYWLRVNRTMYVISLYSSTIAMGSDVKLFDRAKDYAYIKLEIYTRATGGPINRVFKYEFPKKAIFTR